MSTPTFPETYNLIAFLDKPTERDGFEQIVDFLNANPIKYALTVTLTIYTSCIKEFWTCSKVKTVNEDVWLQALVDGKKVIVIEASIRRDLRLDDAERKHKSRRKKRKETKVSQDETPTEEDIPTLPMIHYLVVRIDSKIEKLKKRVKKLEDKKKKRTHRLKRLYKRRIAEIDADEDLFLINETAQDQRRMNDQDMFGVNNLDGDEVVVDVLAGENEEQSKKVAKKEVSNANTVTTASEVVTTADVKVSAALTTTTTTDDELSLARTLVIIKAAKPKALTTVAITVTDVSTRPKEKGIIMQEHSEIPFLKPIVSSHQPSKPKDKGKAKMVEPERPLKRKEHIIMDKQIARVLKAQMQDDLKEEQRIEKQKEEEANKAMIAE
uniref:Xylulose kinase-1 n=1 Tax=Tanacetum cinerariifolium TaxID=118510 RepID=A0A6L2LZ34_TANCI|nr:hypothetical protein [Tanacetum cinerariifolium]